jgi:SM-20-related protein
LQTTYDCLINSYLKDKVGLTNDFLNVHLSAELRAHLLFLHHDAQLKAAGIGDKEVWKQDLKQRGDKIYWLDRAHNHDSESAFLDAIDGFVTYLNRTCYAGITGYEFHYALYEEGSFYVRHLDQFRHNKDRAFSMILYLNPDWEAADGGELCVYHTDSVQIIAPEAGKCVFFKSSELEHEVLTTQKPRLSITGWLKTG